MIVHEIMHQEAYMTYSTSVDYESPIQIFMHWYCRHKKFEKSLSLSHGLCCLNVVGSWQIIYLISLKKCFGLLSALKSVQDLENDVNQCDIDF